MRWATLDGFGIGRSFVCLKNKRWRQGKPRQLVGVPPWLFGTCAPSPKRRPRSSFGGTSCGDMIAQKERRGLCGVRNVAATEGLRFPMISIEVPQGRKDSVLRRHIQPFSSDADFFGLPLPGTLRMASKSSTAYIASIVMGLRPARRSLLITVSLGTFNISAISEMVIPSIAFIIGILSLFLIIVHYKEQILYRCVALSETFLKKVRFGRHFA